MKEKRSKKESNKEKAEKKGGSTACFSREASGASQKEDKQANKINWVAFVKFLNSSLDMYDSQVCRVNYGLSRGQKSRIQRLANEWGKPAIVDAIVRFAKSDVLNGRCASVRFWKASVFWLFERDEHFEKVLGGYYDNPPKKELTPGELKQLAEERRAALQETNRALVRQIEEEERKKREEARDYAAKHAVTYEEYLQMKEEGRL